jgi:thymidylate kinase
MLKLKYLVFSGMDGSGKTTKALFTQGVLNNLNLKSMYVWFRWSAYSSYFVFPIARIARLTIRVNINDKIVFIRRYYMNKPLAYLWVLTQSIDFIISYIFSLLRAKLCKTKVIIYDRFAIPDKIIDLIYESRINVLRVPLIRALIYHFLSKLKDGSMLIVFNKVSPYKVLERRKDLPSISYPFIYDRLYAIILKMLSGSHNVLMLNSERPLNENLVAIAKILNTALHHAI